MVLRTLTWRLTTIALVLGSLLLGTAYGQAFRLPDGRTMQMLPGQTADEAEAVARKKYPEAFITSKPKNVLLPDGSLFPAAPGETPEQALAAARKKYPEAFITSQPKYLLLPDGTYFKAPAGISKEEAERLARAKYPEAFAKTKPEEGSIAWFEAATKDPPTLDYEAAAKSAAISSAIGIGLWILVFWLLKPEGKPRTPVKVARLWVAWFGFIPSVYLTGAVANKKMGVEEFFIGYLPPQLFVLGFVFLAGWLYGRFFKFRTQIAVAGQAADEPIYEAAMRELDGSERRAGVWAKALAESDGDESKAKAKYIQQRAQQIKAER